jgi:hypothetical protein
MAEITAVESNRLDDAAAGETGTDQVMVQCTPATT